MNDSDTARDLYRRLCSVGRAGWGPSPVLLPTEDDALRDLEAELDAFIHRVPIDFEQVPIRVPSIWHAALALLYLHRKLSFADEAADVLLFRGVPSADAGLETTLERLVRDGAPGELWRRLKAKEIFKAAVLVERTMQRWPMTEPSAEAVARHWGGPSELLDVTADPGVAVHFAGGRSGSGEAAVHIMWLGSILQAGGELHCPWPYTGRLARQVGLFLRVQDPAVRARQIFRTVVFPVDEKDRFHLLRNGCAEQLLPEDQWHDTLQRWSLDNAGRMGGSTDAGRIESAAAEFLSHHPSPERQRDAHIAQCAASSRNFSDLVAWIAYIPGREKHRTKMIPEFLYRLTLDNPSMAVMTRDVLYGMPVRTDRDIVRLVAHSLNECLPVPLRRRLVPDRWTSDTEIQRHLECIRLRIWRTEHWGKAMDSRVPVVTDLDRAAPPDRRGSGAGDLQL